MTYEPKEGDVIERGRARLLVRCQSPMFKGVFFVNDYRRKWGVWHETGRRDHINQTELAVMVNHMGWRVLP